MPTRPRPSKAGSEGPLLKTWRQEGASGTQAKVWLSLRRLTAIGIALALMGWLAYLMLSPLFLPKTYFAYWCTDEVQSLVVPPIEYTGEDFAHFTNLENALTPLPAGNKALSYGRLMSPKVLQAELDALKSSAIQYDHPLIVFVSAHGIVREGKAYLICGNFTAAEGNDSLDGLYSASKLVKQLAEVPGGTKLLLLDATRNDYSPRLGMIENNFAHVLKEEISTLKLPSVWVLNSSSPGERSHVSPALKRSVFGYMTTAGLQGAADKNDDGDVTLRELTDFVQFNVSNWVKRSTGDTSSQTPMLLSAGDGQPAGEGTHLLYTTNLPEVRPVSAIMSSAQDEDARSGIVSAIESYLSSDVEQFGLRPVFSAIGSVRKNLQSATEETESESSEESADDSDSARQTSQNDIELGLFDEAWRLTQAIPPGPKHPANYAPELWRIHLDRLIWLEYQQQSGERMNQLPLIDELRGLIQSLKVFSTTASYRTATNPNIVDRMRQAAPTVPVAANEAPTLGLVEAIAAADPNQPLPEKLAAFVKDYDTWLRNPEGMDRLDAIKQANWMSAWENYYELQLLDTYRRDPDVSMDTAKLAFQVRRVGEQVAADLVFGQGWGAELIADADRLRLEAERLLQDHADAEWLKKATSNLERARALYANAQTSLAEVQRAMQLRNESLVRARDYLRWCRYCWGDAASRAPSAQRIEGLLVSVRDLSTALDSPTAAGAPNINDLQRLHDDIERQLQQGVDELASSPYEPGDSERLAALLKTALLDADQRARCISARVQADADLMRSFETSLPVSTVTAPPRSSTRAALAIDQAKTEAKMLEFFSPNANRLTPEWPEMAQTDTSAIAAAGKVLGEWLFQLNDLITKSAVANSNLSDFSQRTQRFGRLQRAGQGLYLIDSIDASSLSTQESSLAQQVFNALWFDLLRSIRDRFIRAQADASVEESLALRQLGNQCGAAASKIPGQPELMNLEAPLLALQVPAAAAELVTTDEMTVDLAVQSFGYDGPVWVIAQYDPQAIAVTGSNWTILSQQEVEDAPIDEASTRHPGYPYWPQARRNVSETMTLTTGQSRELGIKLRRLSNARGNTTLVLRAIGDRYCIRQQLPVRLPGRQDLEISIAGGRTVRRNLESKIRLFANRTQELTIYVTNTGDKDRTVVASMYAPQQGVSFPIPTGSIESTEAAQILQRIGIRNGVAIGSVPLNLSPGSLPKAILFDFQTPENKLLLGATPKEGPVKLNVSHGVLLDIVDQESSEHTIRWLQFEAWRPHTFLEARATYDPASRRLLVTAEPRDPELCPDDEIELTLEIDKEFTSGRGGTSTTYLKPPNYRGELEATLTGRWPRDLNPLAEDFLAIGVNVDKYPRGFEFRLPKTTTVTNILPTKDKASLRFVTPKPEANYKATRSISAHVQVEVPEGYFNIPNSYVEIGVDKNQDRELRDEESITLQTDRQLEFFAKLPIDGGTLAIEPDVGDFELTLRTAGIRDREVNVLGQLTTAGRVSERSYIPIVLDGEGPELGVVKLVRKGPVLVVEVTPEDLTGVKSVEAAFESSNEIKWQPGKRGDGGQWFVELSTEGLSPGQHFVLLRATDNVGNTCEEQSTPWTNNPAESVTAPAREEGNPRIGGPRAVKNQVKGRVIYGTKEVTNIEVTLTGAGAPAQPARAGAGGSFDFGMVPPGTYALKARGLAGGNYHKAELQVTVSDQPNTPVELEVKVR